MRNLIRLRRTEAVRYTHLRGAVLAPAHDDPLHEQLYEFTTPAASLWRVFIYLRHALLELQEPLGGVSRGKAVTLPRGKVSLDALEQ